jgi:hypothetical protein
MMKIFRFFGKLIGFVLVLVFILSMFVNIFLLAFTNQLFNPDFYLEVFEEVDFFDQLPELAATQIHHSMTFNPCLEDPDMCENEEPSNEGGGEGGPPSYFQALSEDDWETLLTELLPPDWLENQLHDLVHNLFDSIRSGSEEMTVSISLLDLKEHLTGEAGAEAITQLMKNQPECTEDDLLDMTRILDGRQDTGKDFLTCNPGNDFLDNYMPQIESLLRRSLKDIPEEIDLAKGLGDKEINFKPFGIDLPLTVFINSIRWAIMVSPLLNLLLLLVIAFLAVHSFKALRIWWGYPIAIAGLLASGLAFLAGPAANFLLDRFGGDLAMTGLHESLVDTGSGLALQILHTLFTQARNYALIVTAIGLSIIIISSVLKDPGPKPIDDQETEESLEKEKEKKKKKKRKKKKKVDEKEEPLPDDELGKSDPPDEEVEPPLPEEEPEEDEDEEEEESPSEDESDPEESTDDEE